MCFNHVYKFCMCLHISKKSIYLYLHVLSGHYLHMLFTHRRIIHGNKHNARVQYVFLHTCIAIAYSVLDKLINTSLLVLIELPKDSDGNLNRVIKGKRKVEIYFNHSNVYFNTCNRLIPAVVKN